jgi:hypothetical protein
MSINLNLCNECKKPTLLVSCARCLLKGTPQEHIFDTDKTIKKKSNIISIMDIHKLKIIKNSKKASFTDLGNDKPKNKRYTWHTLPPTEPIDNDFLKKNNWGIICNKANGILGVDLDCYKWSAEHGCHKADAFYEKFGNDYIKKFNTYTQKTPSGGIHLVFLYDKDLNQTESKKDSKFGKGIDIRNGHNDELLSGGYLVGAGSVFKKPNGEIGTYELLNDEKPKKIPDELKEWLIDNIYTTQEILKDKSTIYKKNNILKLETEFTDTIYKYNITEPEMRDVLKTLPINYLDEYANWFKFTTAMKALNLKNLWDELSIKARNYNKENNELKYNSIVLKGSNYFIEFIFKLCKNFEYLDFIKYKPIPINTIKPHRIINRPKLTSLRNDEEKQTDKPLNLNLAKTKKGFVIKSDTGTGKTTLTKNELLASGQKFISIVSRVSLGKEQYHTFNEAGVDCHFYANHWVKENESIITTIDSIIGCNDILRKINEYTVFIDEFNSVIEYIMQADTCLNKTRSKCWGYLIYILQNCKNFICVDADISDLCFTLLKYVDKDYEYIQNTYNHNKGVPAKELLSLDEVITTIKKQERYMVACDSKKSAEYLWIQTGKKAKLLTSKTDKLNDETLDNFPMIIFSPAVIYGLDSSLRRPVFCYHKENTISPTNMVQQISRCRDIETLYFCFQKKKFQQAKYLNKQDCVLDIKDKAEFSSKEFNILDKDEIERENVFNNIYTDYLYKQDCYNTNKYVHFKLLLQTRGFNVEYYNTKSIKPNQNIINGIVLEFNSDNFDVDSQTVKDYNDKYLHLTRKQLLDVKELFIQDELRMKMFSLKSYFEHGLKNRPLFDSENKYDKIKDKDFAQTITKEQIATYYDCENTYDKLSKKEDFKIKKMTTTDMKYYMIDKFKCIVNFKETSNDTNKNIITANRIPTAEEQKNYITSYKKVFDYRGKKEPSINTTYDCEQFLYKMMKSTFSKDIFNDIKKVRVGKKTQYIYSMNYDCQMLTLTKKIMNYQRMNTLTEQLYAKANNGKKTYNF